MKINVKDVIATFVVDNVVSENKDPDGRLIISFVLKHEDFKYPFRHDGFAGQLSEGWSKVFYPVKDIYLANRIITDKNQALINVKSEDDVVVKLAKFKINVFPSVTPKTNVNAAHYIKTAYETMSSYHETIVSINEMKNKKAETLTDDKIIELHNKFLKDMNKCLTDEVKSKMSKKPPENIDKEFKVTKAVGKFTDGSNNRIEGTVT